MGRTIKGLKERRSYTMAKDGLPQFTSNFQGWSAMAKKAAEPKELAPEPEKILEEARPAVEMLAVEETFVATEEILTTTAAPMARKIEHLDNPAQTMELEPLPALPTRMNVEMEAAEESWAATITAAAAASEASPVEKETPAVGASARLDRTTDRPGVWRLFLQKLMFRRPPVKVKSVQTELALDRVAVVRNDLSDDDLEVRPRKTAKGRNPFKTAAEAKSRRTRAAKEEKETAPEPVLAGAESME
jgi:hypothetical protein